MVDGWVPVWDQSFNRVPVSRLHEMYDAGYRVMSGYEGGGSSNKWLTQKEIGTWLSLGPDTGIAALFEINGTEPIDNPSSGAIHAKQARAAWRAMGYPDNAAICPAVDENVTVAQAKAQLSTYFHYWANNDTHLPIAYVEPDAGIVLYDNQFTCGTFTPAAYLWDVSKTLITPDNAPSHVLWTQEHNGRSMAGGIIDIGHIRISAPIEWKDKAMADNLDLVTVPAGYTDTNAKITVQAALTSIMGTVIQDRNIDANAAKALTSLTAYMESPQFIADIAAASANGATPQAIAEAVISSIKAVWAA